MDGWSMAGDADGLEVEPGLHAATTPATANSRIRSIRFITVSSLRPAAATSPGTGQGTRRAP